MTCTLAALSSLLGTDVSTHNAQHMVLQAMGELLIPGTGEYEDANLVRLGEYREAARVVSEPAIAGIVAHEVCLDPGLMPTCAIVICLLATYVGCKVDLRLCGRML